MTRRVFAKKFAVCVFYRVNTFVYICASVIVGNLPFVKLKFQMAQIDNIQLIITNIGGNYLVVGPTNNNS